MSKETALTLHLPARFIAKVLKLHLFFAQLYMLLFTKRLVSRNASKRFMDIYHHLVKIRGVRIIIRALRYDQREA